MGNLKVEQWKTENVIPYKNNPRHNDQAVDSVAESIRQFGFQQPIVVDTDGVIIVGHTRLKAAKKLGLKTVPVIVAENLSEEKAKAYRLADNKTGELAGWNFELLGIELEELKELSDIDMTDFGFPDINQDMDDFFQDEPQQQDDFEEQSEDEIIITCVCNDDIQKSQLIEFCEEKDISYKV